MQEAFIRTLSGRRAQIRARWEGFLRVERVNTPLANPDTLVYLFDQTLDEVFRMLRHPPVRHPAAPLDHTSGQNPLVAYFIAGEQALLESLILAQAESRGLDPAERDADLAELKTVVRTIARRDIGSLEGLSRSKKSGAVTGSI
jgi:hypothetical protein